MAADQQKVIRPARCIHGVLRPPGDKSISHRYAMLAALAEGQSEFENFAPGADCASTLTCLRRLGREINNSDGKITISGQGSTLKSASGTLDCGNSGSTMRMLAGILAGQPFTSELGGDSSLNKRPMERIITPLSRMGARIESAKEQRPPLKINGGALKAIDYQIPVASAQVKSCLLFAGLLAQGKTVLHEPVRTRDHGELALKAFGVKVETAANGVTVEGGQKLAPLSARIPGDISSAAFFMCAAAILPGSELVIEDLLLNPTRAAILDVLKQLGASIQIIDIAEQHGELVGTIKVKHQKLQGAKIAGARAAQLIDELPVLAAIAPFTAQGTEISGAAELRVKESDRIAAVTANLRAMGAEVEELKDGWRIPGKQKLHGAEIDDAGDHRIVMAFSVAALGAEGESTIRNARGADISYPQFFQHLRELTQP